MWFLYQKVSFIKVFNPFNIFKTLRKNWKKSNQSSKNTKENFNQQQNLVASNRKQLEQQFSKLQTHVYNNQVKNEKIQDKLFDFYQKDSYILNKTKNTNRYFPEKIQPMLQDMTKKYLLYQDTQILPGIRQIELETTNFLRVLYKACDLKFIQNKITSIRETLQLYKKSGVKTYYIYKTSSLYIQIGQEMQLYCVQINNLDEIANIQDSVLITSDLKNFSLVNELDIQVHLDVKSNLLKIPFISGIQESAGEEDFDQIYSEINFEAKNLSTILGNIETGQQNAFVLLTRSSNQQFTYYYDSYNNRIASEQVSSETIVTLWYYLMLNGVDHLVEMLQAEYDSCYKIKKAIKQNKLLDYIENYIGELYVYGNKEDILNLQNSFKRQNYVFNIVFRDQIYLELQLQKCFLSEGNVKDIIKIIADFRSTGICKDNRNINLSDLSQDKICDLAHKI